VSFAYLPLFTGDYLKDTRHLTPMRHGVYLLALMHCWDTKGPMPLDEQEQVGICNCRSGDEVEALRYVLGKYFIRMEDGWYNERMQTEVERSEAISKKRSRAGQAGARVTHSAASLRAAKNSQNVVPIRGTGVTNSVTSSDQIGHIEEDQEVIEGNVVAIAKQVLSNCQASATTSSSSSSSVKPKIKTSGAVAPVGLPDWLCPQAWQEWRDHRKAIRKRMTPLAETKLLLALGRLRDSGEDPVAVLEQAIANGWTGLYPVKSATGGRQGAAAAAAAALKLIEDEERLREKG